MRAILCSLLLALPAIGQTVHYVDATGAGGAFTTLQAAVAAAASGDIVRVRATGFYDFGLFAPPVTIGTGLTIVSDAAPVPFLGRFEVTNLPASQRVVLRGFVAAYAGSSGAGTVRITNCQGPVVLDDMQLDGYRVYGSGAGTGLVVDASSDVTVHACSVQGTPAMTATSSTVAIGSSTIHGLPSDYGALVNGRPGLVATASQVSMVATSVLGSAPDPGGAIAGAAGMTTDGGLVRMAGGSVVGGGGASTPYDAVTMTATATFVRDATTNVPQAIVGGTQSLAATGRVAFSPAAPGQPASFAMQGPAGSIGALFWSLPVAPTPSPLGPLWGHPHLHVVVGFGTLPLSATLPIPTWATVADVFVVQGLLIDQGRVVLSNPVRATVR